MKRGVDLLIHTLHLFPLHPESHDDDGCEQATSSRHDALRDAWVDNYLKYVDAFDEDDDEEEEEDDDDVEEETRKGGSSSSSSSKKKKAKMKEEKQEEDLIGWSNGMISEAIERDFMSLQRSVVV